MKSRFTFLISFYLFSISHIRKILLTEFIQLDDAVIWTIMLKSALAETEEAAAGEQQPITEPPAEPTPDASTPAATPALDPAPVSD